MPKVNLYHIAYSSATLLEAPAGYKILNNVDSSRKDWFEYWPIRKFLLEEVMDDDSYYGFFSPRFFEKTGLDHAEVTARVLAAGPDMHVVLFSPQADMGALYLNMFEQQNHYEPGFIEASEAFFKWAGVPLSLWPLIMDSRQIVFSNYFVARPIFWREWLTWNEKLFSLCEGVDNAVKQLLVSETTYYETTSVQKKVFLMERMASLLLTAVPEWRVHTTNTFDYAWSGTKSNQYKTESILCDALKIAMKEQGFPSYSAAFDKLRYATMRLCEV